MVLALVLALGGCRTLPYRPFGLPRLCQDNQPVKVLQDPACLPDGFCGWSCLPDRWE